MLIREINYNVMTISNENIYYFENNNTNNKKLLDNNLIVKEKIINNFPTNKSVTTDDFQDTSYNITFYPNSVYSNLLLDYNILYNSSSKLNKSISFKIIRYIRNDNTNKDNSNIIILDTSLNIDNAAVSFKNIYSIFYIDELSN